MNGEDNFGYDREPYRLPEDVENKVNSLVNFFISNFPLEVESSGELNDYLTDLKEKLNSAGLNELDYDISKLFNGNYIHMYLAFLAFRIRKLLNVEADIVIIDQKIVGEAKELYDVFINLLLKTQDQLTRSLKRNPSLTMSTFSGMYEGAMSAFRESLWNKVRDISKSIDAFELGEAVFTLYSEIIGRWITGLYDRLTGVIGHGASSVISSILAQNEALLYRSAYETFDYLFKKYVVSN